MNKALNKEVPEMLVQTWITLALNIESVDEVKIRALSMLQEVIGTSYEKRAIEIFIALARNKKSSKKVKDKAFQSITNSVGSVEEIVSFMKRHNIQ